MDRYLTPAEQTALLNAARLTHTPTAQRDYHLFSALILSGCRINEFLTVSIGQTAQALRSGYLFLPKEVRKGRAAHFNHEGKWIPDQRKDHRVYLSTQLRAHLTALLKMSLSSDSVGEESPLLTGHKGERLTVRAVQKRVKHWADVAGIGGDVSPHWFRHTHAMNIMRTSTAKNPLQVVQRSLGQSSISSAGIYAHATREEVQADLERAAQAMSEQIQGKKRITLAQLRREHLKSMEAVA